MEETQTLVDDHALDSVARTRALGMHFFGHFVGIYAAPTTDGQVRIQIDNPHTGASDGIISPIGLATLADLALSSAIRKQLEPSQRLGTVTLGMQLIGSFAKGAVSAETTPVWMDLVEGLGHARCDLFNTSHQLIGVAQGSFAVLPVSDGKSLPPPLWEGNVVPAIAPLALKDLNSQERAAVTAASRAIDRTRLRGTPLADELLALIWLDEIESEMVRGVTRLGPELANRIGHVQGGAIYGAALLAAGRAAGPGTRLADGNLHYLRPAEGSTLTVEARILRRGRRMTFTEAYLTVDGNRVAAGQFAFRNVGGTA